MTVIEKRAYGPESSEAEIQMLKSRVQLLDDTTVYIDEVPVMSPFEIKVIGMDQGLVFGFHRKVHNEIFFVFQFNDSLSVHLNGCYQKSTFNVNMLLEKVASDTFQNLRLCSIHGGGNTAKRNRGVGHQGFIVHE